MAKKRVASTGSATGASTGSATGGKDFEDSKVFEEGAAAGSASGISDSIAGSDTIARAREIFGRSTAQELYFTTDGTAFYQAAHAAIHCENFENKQIITIKREEIE